MVQFYRHAIPNDKMKRLNRNKFYISGWHIVFSLNIEIIEHVYTVEHDKIHLFVKDEELYLIILFI